MSWRKDLWENIDAALLWLAMEPAGRLDRWLRERKKVKLYHDGREIRSEAVDYGDGNVMIEYADTGQVVIIDKSEIESR